MPGALENLQIVVAGGTGGLGSVAARQLASEGALVTVSYKQRPVDGAVCADLAVAADRARLLDAAPGLYGLAVFTGDPVRIADPAEAMLRSHEVNYMGPVLLAREAAERMKASGTRGAIVLISTMQAVALFAGSTAYAAQKAALLHAGRILAKECRGATDIRVNIICPGVNQAGMAQASIAAGKYDRFIKENAIPRFGRAEDVARAVRFFLEPDSYVTGQVLVVDGGLTL